MNYIEKYTWKCSTFFFSQEDNTINLDHISNTRYKYLKCCLESNCYLEINVINFRDATVI